jgi:hypothetical protein
MTWFKIDDQFHSHPKVLACDPAAIGLWVLAGSWCSANLTDGLIQDHVIGRLVPGDAVPLAKQLTTSGLWKRVRGGYRFHDWSEYNPTSEAVRAEREAARDRMRRARAKRAEQRKQKQETAAQAPDCSGEHTPNFEGTSPEVRSTPTRPDPTRPEPTVLKTSSSVPSELQKKSRASTERGTRIPDDFEVTPDMETWARSNVPELAGCRETEKFVNYWASQPGTKGRKLDWERTWKNWMLRAAEQRPVPRQAAQPTNLYRNPPRDDDPFAGLEIVTSSNSVNWTPETAS